MQAPLPAERVQAELMEVLRRAELSGKPSLLERLIDWLAPHLDTREVEALGDVLFFLCVALLVLALAVFLRRLWLAWPERIRPVDAARPAPEVGGRLAELVAAAHAARTAGDLRLALRLHFHALLIALGGRGDLELRAAWTNRELVSRGKLSREARALLAPLVRELEPKEFGRATVVAADVERLEQLLAAARSDAGGPR